MTRCPRYERLAALALGIGARIAPRGDGRFQALHRGARFELRNLREVAAWLASVSPEHGRAVEVAALSDTRFQQTMKVARKQAKSAARAGGQL